MRSSLLHINPGCPGHICGALKRTHRRWEAGLGDDALMTSVTQEGVTTLWQRELSELAEEVRNMPRLTFCL